VPEFKNIYTYENIQKLKMAVVPDTLDTREGSVIWTTVAANSFEMALAYMQMSINQNNAFPDTANREYLIRHCTTRGITPYPATNAVIHGEFFEDIVEKTPYNPPVGTRFTLQNTKLKYKVTEQISDGNWKLVCETPGTAGNISVGSLVPVDDIQALGGAIIVKILMHGEEEEETEALRKRYMESLKATAFAGNKAAYKEMCRGLDNVGACKVYRSYNDQPGHVGLCILDDKMNVPSTDLVSAVQKEIDPNQKGDGDGLAPIDHIVHVFGATETVLPVSLKITPVNESVEWNSILVPVTEIIQEYFNDLRNKWDSTDTTIVRPTQLIARLLALDTILDVPECLIGGSASPIALDSTSIPKVGVISGGIELTN
jgi:uncharacterized phage protein gp47/JayE